MHDLVITSDGFGLVAERLRGAIASQANLIQNGE
jgi:hypothetical protein